MKTLIIQLARLGDIYLTWPVIQHLAKDSNQEIHLLVRETFFDATIGLPKNVIVHKLPTRDLLLPILEGEDGVSESLKEFEKFLAPFLNQDFDQVVNLSFSPFSSHLTRCFEESGSQVFGYTRHSDGYLNPIDDTSAYFYAQVGIDKPNRFHLSDLFAMMLNIDLEDSDRRASELPASNPEIQQHLRGLEDVGYVVLHVGASDKGKTLSGPQLKSIVLELLNTSPYSIVLIGSKAETQIAESLKPKVGSWRITNLVGLSRVPDLFQILSKAKALIGVDSAPIHIASLTNTPTLNLSCRHVCSYETGPRATLAKVLRCNDFSQLDPIEIAEVVLKLINGESPEPLKSENAVLWDVVRALYLGLPYPKQIRRSTGLILSRCIDFMPHVINAYRTPLNKDSQKLIGDFDELLASYAKADPFVKIFIDWFNAERIRIPPSDFQDVSAKSLQIVQNLHLVLSDWARQLGENVVFLDERVDWSEQLNEVVKHFRFYNLDKGVEGLQDFLAENAYRISVGGLGEAAVDVQKQIETALKKADYSRVADILEYDLRSLMSGKDMIA